MVTLIILLFYLIFLIIYLIFNAYLINRVFEMKIEGDRSILAIYFLLGAIALIMMLTFVILIAQGLEGI